MTITGATNATSVSARRRPISRWLPIGCGLREDTLALQQKYRLGITSASTIGTAVAHFPTLTNRIRAVNAQSLAELETMAIGIIEIPCEALSYNLESGSPAGEVADPPAAVLEARAIADAYGRDLMLAMGGQLADTWYADWATMAASCDYWMIQAQRQQVDPPGMTFRGEVEWRVNELRSYGPLVCAQLSVTPGPSELTAAEVLNYIRWLSRLRIRAISIYDGLDPNKPLTLTAVLNRIYG